MRPGATAALSLVSAAVGAALVLAAADGTDRLGGGTRTVVVETTAAEDDRIAVASPRADGEFDPAAIYAERAPGVVTIYARFGRGEGQGSGFVVSEDGVILTNSHVITTAGEAAPGARVRAAREVFVEFKDGDVVPAEIVGWDIFDDVGVLRVDPRLHALDPVPLGDSSRVVVGEPVAAIGSPFGEESSLAVGVVSATRRSIRALTSEYQLVDAIQTDAPINRGNSGGPLFDARGRVIGINAQIRTETGVNEGVGFAVPINAARRSLEQLLEDGRVRYAFVGISTDDLTPSLARRLGLKESRGALVVRVSEGPARAAGLRGGSRELVHAGRPYTVGGDVVVAIDGRPVRSGDDLVRIVAGELRPGQTARFEVLRDGGYRMISVTLAERPAQPPAD